MSKIIIGTGKLGRVIPHSYKKSLIDILGQALEKGLDVHVSPTYGNSLKPKILIKSLMNLSLLTATAVFGLFLTTTALILTIN